jgi:hypothetical protein
MFVHFSSLSLHFSSISFFTFFLLLFISQRCRRHHFTEQKFICFAYILVMSGRQAHLNGMKYLKMAASSNLGNVLSLIIAALPPHGATAAIDSKFIV